LPASSGGASAAGAQPKRTPGGLSWKPAGMFKPQVCELSFLRKYCVR
jgi:hypothetical protein